MPCADIFCAENTTFAYLADVDRSLGHISSSISVVAGLSHTPSLTALLIELRELNNTATKLAGEVTCSNLHRNFPTPAHIRPHLPTSALCTVHAPAPASHADPRQQQQQLRAWLVFFATTNSSWPTSVCHGCCHDDPDEFAG